MDVFESYFYEYGKNYEKFFYYFSKSYFYATDCKKINYPRYEELSKNVFSINADCFHAFLECIRTAGLQVMASI